MTRIGRFAIALKHQARGRASLMLVRALRKAYENAGVVGSSMVVVDALDENAAEFYRAHGFIRLPGSIRLVLPMRTLRDLFA